MDAERPAKLRHGGAAAGLLTGAVLGVNPCQVGEEKGHVSWQQVETPAPREGGGFFYFFSA